MKSKHTPGPWRVEKGEFIDDIIGSDRQLVATCYKEDNGKDNANSCMIAAAPDLLTALELIMERQGQETMFKFPDNCQAMVWARVAIAKAKGDL